MKIAFAVFLALLAVTSLTKVDILVMDSSGAALGDELVIVQDMAHAEHEIARKLTDASGAIPSLNLPPGFYRAIVTDPYGPWETEVREFLVRDTPVHLQIRVPPLPTHGYGDIITGVLPMIKATILNSDGRPAAGATLFVRDRNATLYLERFYRTNSLGEATIELVSDPTVVVVIFGDLLTTKEISKSSGSLTIRLP